MRQYTAPIVNMNGSPEAGLVAPLVTVMRKSSELMDALKDARPHPRDFQISPEGDYKQAEAEWMEMVMAVNMVNDWALAVGLKIKNQKA